MKTTLEWKPPRTKEELDAAYQRAMKRPEYFERVRQFAFQMKYMQVYMLNHFVNPENRNIFRDCICLLIAREGFPIEFDDNFEKVRRCDP